MGLHGLMSSTAQYELEKLPQFIEECTMVYLPNLGYLLGVKSWAPNLTREAKELENLKFMVNTSNINMLTAILYMFKIIYLPNFFYKIVLPIILMIVSES